MKAGRELDDLMATEVMEWEKRQVGKAGRWVWVLAAQERLVPTMADSYWSPSIYIASAMEVVGHTLRGWDKPDWEPEFSLACCLRDKDEPIWWEAQFGLKCFGVGMDDEWLAWAEGATASHAICVAALKAKGIEIEE